MNEVVIVIPVYKVPMDADEKVSFELNLRQLESHDINVIAPIKFSDDAEFSRIIANHRVEPVYFDNKYFCDIDGYNELMLKIEFYTCFKHYKYMLICQLDSIVISDQLNYWILQDYDYIGAPWFVESGDGYTFDSMGNGGFSLRKIKTFIQVLESNKIYYSDYKMYGTSYRAGIVNMIKIKIMNLLMRFDIHTNYSNLFLLIYRENEDFFWSFYAKFFVDRYKIPTPLKALQFSFEKNPRKCYEFNNHTLPFGCHAWQKYDRMFWEDQFPILSTKKNNDS